MCRRLVRHPRTDHVGWRLKNVSYCSSSARPPPPCAGLLRRTGRVFERPPHDPARPSVFSRTHPATRSRASPAWLSRLLVRGSPLGLSLRLDAPPPSTRSLAVRRILVSRTTGGRSVSSRHARTALALPPAVSGSSPAAERLSHVFSGHRGACGVPLGPAAQCADAFAQAAAAASPRASRCVRVAFWWLSFQGGLVLRLFLWIANVQNTLVFCLYNLKDRSVGYKTGVIISFLRTCGFRFECCHGNI